MWVFCRLNADERTSGGEHVAVSIPIWVFYRLNAAALGETVVAGFNPGVGFLPPRRYGTKPGRKGWGESAPDYGTLG